MKAAIILQGFTVGMLAAVASAETTRTAPRGSRSQQPHSVLRGLKKEKEEKSSKSKSTPKEKQPPPVAPGGGATRQKTGSKKKLYTEYSFFVEACQEELVADVINGGLIQHRQFSDFVYGYCRESDNEGKECSKDQELLGFDHLPNEIKLLYIKSFCPQDVQGQVECLHGINDRGRTYEVHDEIEQLCGDLEKSLVKTGLLKEPDKKDSEEVVADDEEEFLEAGQQDNNGLGNNAGFDPTDGYTAVNAAENSPTEFTFDNIANAPTPTIRPTERPTNKPTKESKNQSNGGTPWVGAAPTGPWGETASMSAPVASVSDAEESAPGTGDMAPRPTMRPTLGQPALTVNSRAQQDSDGGMSGGGITAIVLIVLLALVISSLAVLFVRRRRLQDDRNMSLRQEFFLMFTKPRKVSTDDQATFDETYEKSYQDHNNEGSIASEEIDFNNNGPLFDSWPNVSKSRSRNASLDESETEPELGSSLGDPSTYKSSLLHSFFSKSAEYLRPSEDANKTPLQNAVDEIKRGISEARWQDVYYLASKMAAEGNIDSDENLQAALVSKNESGGDYKTHVGPTREHLNPADAGKAAQLDASLVTGDWITLAARAAVFAALDNADNPVPSCITIAPGKGNAEECLANARVALEEAQKVAKEREEKIRQQHQEETPSVSDTAESEAEESSEGKVAFVSAGDVSIDCEEEEGFEYPSDDYSDFSQTESSKNSSSTNKSKVSVITKIMTQKEAAKDDDQEVTENENENEGSQDENDDNSEKDESVQNEGDADDKEADEDDSATASRNDLPGPPSIAMSNQSTIPTEASTTKDVPFTSLTESSRGPFRRDFENEISHPMEQQSQPEEKPAKDGAILRRSRF